MIRVISSPSSSTTGFLTLILATPVLHTPRGSLRPLATGSRPARAVRQSGGASQRAYPRPGPAGLNRRAPAPRGPALAQFGKAADAYSAGWASAGAASAAGAAGSTEM